MDRNIHKNRGSLKDKGNNKRFGSRVVLIHLFYDLAFLAALILTFPYIAYRILTSRRFRAGMKHRLGFVPRRPCAGPAIWIHGVSVGEIKTIQPLLLRIESAYPEVEWAISTTTLAGCQMAKKLFGKRFIFYFPLDIGFIVRKVIRRIRPDLIILMELEIWPNLLYEADRFGAPLCIVNGRISEKSFRGYQKLKKLLPEMNRISLFSVQNQDYADRLLALDVPADRVKITGNIKYDGIDTSEVPDVDTILGELKLNRGMQVLVAGSTHGGEEELLFDILLQLRERFPMLRLVVAPRHIERVDEIEKACTRRGLTSVRRTAIRARQSDLTPDEVLLLDTIGELDRVYGAADIVFVGGSLVPVGGHNMMEPAGKGKPVLYGPHNFNFLEEVALLKRADAAVQVEDGPALQAWIARLLTHREEARALGERARETIARAKGATDQNFDLIDAIFLKPILENER